MESINRDILSELHLFLGDFDFLNLLGTCKELNNLKYSVIWQDYHDYEINHWYTNNLSKIVCYKGQYSAEDFNLYNSNIKAISMYDDFNFPIVLPKKLEVLELCNQYNQPLVGLHLLKLQTLIMGNAFNQSIILPKFLNELHMGYSFNSDINLHENIEYLSIGDGFSEYLLRKNLKDNEVESINLSKFNKLKYLYIDARYEKDIILPETLEIFESGCSFNGKLKNLGQLKQIKCLNMGRGYNVSLDLPICLEKLQLMVYTKKLEQLDKLIHLKQLCIGCEYNYSLNLPENLQELELGYKFNKKLKNFENLKQLTYFKAGAKFNREIILPENLEHLELGHVFNKQIEIEHLKNLTYFKMSTCFNQEIILPENLEHLELGINFNKSIKINDLKYLTYFKMGDEFNKAIIFPENLEHLELGFCFDKQIQINNLKYLKYFKMGCEFNKEIVFPENLEYLELGSEYNYPINQILENLEVFKLGLCFNQELPNLKKFKNLKEISLGSEFDQLLYVPDSLTKITGDRSVMTVVVGNRAINIGN